MPKCPQCGHKWTDTRARAKDVAALAAQLDERLGAFPDAVREGVVRFLGMADSVRRGGMTLAKKIEVLDEFAALCAEDMPVFEYALRQVLQSETFDWTRPRITSYLSAIYKRTRAQGGPPSIEDTADRYAIAILSVWHRWFPLSHVSPKRCEDLADGHIIYRLVHALHRDGHLPEIQPPREKLAGHIRQILASAEQRRREIRRRNSDAAFIGGPEVSRDRLSRAQSRDQGAVARPRPLAPSDLPPELAELKTLADARRAAREKEDEQVWRAER